MRGRLGERILSEAFTVVDRPHVDYSPGAAEMDGDGVPTREIAIIEEGVLKSFLYDLDTAGLAGVAPTGNGGCRAHYADLAGGERESKEMIAGMEDGVYIKDLLGFGQSNVMNGDFASNVSLGFAVKNGEIVGRVKNTMIAGNVYELLKEGVELSRDRDPVERIPYAMVEGLAVSAGG